MPNFVMRPSLRLAFAAKYIVMSMRKYKESLDNMSVGCVDFASGVTLLDITQLICRVAQLFLPSLKVKLWRHRSQGRRTSHISILCTDKSPCSWALVCHGRGLSLHSLCLFASLTATIDAPLITFCRQVIALAVILWPFAAKDAWLTIWASKIDLDSIVV